MTKEKKKKEKLEQWLEVKKDAKVNAKRGSRPN